LDEIVVPFYGTGDLQANKEPRIELSAGIAVTFTS
jgi:hypothetical protein